MDPVNGIDVKETIKMFELQVEEQMLPQGMNPIGLGNLLTTSEHGLSREDMPKLILGHIQPQQHKTEHGTKAEMEKRNLHKRAFGKDVFGKNGEFGPDSASNSASGFDNARIGLPRDASADSGMFSSISKGYARLILQEPLFNQIENLFQSEKTGTKWLRQKTRQNSIPGH